MPWLNVTPRLALLMAMCIVIASGCSPPSSPDDDPGNKADAASGSVAPPDKKLPEFSPDLPPDTVSSLDSAALDDRDAPASPPESAIDNRPPMATSATAPATDIAAPKPPSAETTDGPNSIIKPNAIKPAQSTAPESQRAAAGAGTATLAEDDIRQDAEAVESADPRPGGAEVGSAGAGANSNYTETVLESGTVDADAGAEAMPPPVAAAIVTDERVEQSPGADGPPDSPPIDPCKQYVPDYDTWLDRGQVAVYQTVCGATAWFDGFFGDNRYDQATGETYGRISLGGYWDQLNGFDPRLRFRARFALPSLRDRGSLLIGRGDEDDLIEERTTAVGDQIPTTPGQNSNQGQDVSTYIGFGWDRLATLTRGLRLSVGVKLRNPPVPIVKVKYRRNWQISERDLLSVRPIAYWRSDEGAGATLQVDVDHVINSAFLLRWANFGNISEDEEVEGVNWGSTFFLYQALSEKKAMTYSIFFTGETKAPVSFQNTGLELRYRQSILRKWLFIEPYGSLSWPRYALEDKRESNFGVGLRLEAYFGPAPEEWMR